MLNEKQSDMIEDKEKEVLELISNYNEEQLKSQDEPKIIKEEKIFKKYTIKDIVFLAIITACTLVTGAVMPLLVNVPLFGIIQLGLGIQFSLFPVIGLMKVKKPFSLLLQSIFISIFLVFMFPPMVLIILCALVVEALTLLIFRGYKNDWACVFATTLYMPMTIPLLLMYYNMFYSFNGNEKAAVSMFIGGGNVGVILGITMGVIALCFLGSFIGMIIARELKKAGKLK
ncbi:MAG: hypothetical protein K2I42_03750 [Anaeroplasmataceae bacterium]|nr:hypothetical protein [Anaeroplasmataceae bacterium]